MNDNQIEKAFNDLTKFLEENPHLIPLQLELEKKMLHMGPQARLEFITGAMVAKSFELKERLDELNTILETIAERSDNGTH